MFHRARYQTEEELLANNMGFAHAVLFARARDAIRVYCGARNVTELAIPSNVCQILQQIIHRPIIFNVSAETGIAKAVPVQLYGYRTTTSYCELDIDPLMTGMLSRPFAHNAVVSFGKCKTIDIAAGGGFLTNDANLVKEMGKQAYFPAHLRRPLLDAILGFNRTISARRHAVSLWDRHLGDSCIRIPMEQVIPWRVIRRIPKKRDAVVKALRAAGFDAGTNYPPLPGVTDPGAIQWGKEVVNFWVSEDYDEPRIRAACEIIKRTIG